MRQQADEHVVPEPSYLEVRFPPNSGQVFKQLSPHLSGTARSE